MKKLVIIAAMSLCAACVQAASVVWSTTSVKGPDGNSVGSSSAYTATVTFWTDKGGAPDQVISTTGLTDSTAAMSKYTGTTGDAFGANTTYWTQLVVSDGNNTITSEKVSFKTDSAASYEINFSTGNGFSDSGAKINYASGWSTVPEPTSALLMLLGVAGLALKRKRV